MVQELPLVPLILEPEVGDVLETGVVELASLDVAGVSLLLGDGPPLLAPYPELVVGADEDGVGDPVSAHSVLVALDGMLVGLSPELDDGDPLIVELVEA